MVAGVAGNESLWGSGIRHDEPMHQQETLIQLAQKKLEKAVRQVHRKRPFAYIRFHRIPINDIEKQASFREFTRVIVCNSTVFSPGEVQLGILVGHEYVVVDWDWEITQKEESELARKLIQHPGWKWRRGWFVNDASTISKRFHVNQP